MNICLSQPISRNPGLLLALFFSVTLAACGGSGAGTAVVDQPPEDVTPNAFSFDVQTEVALESEVTSEAITISGTNTAAAISVSAGSEYAIDGGAFTGEVGTIENGQTVQVRHTSASTFDSITTTTLTVGGLAVTFSSVTLQPDNVPDEFEFILQTGVALNTEVTSNAITISGTNTETSISVTGGQYAIGDGAYTSEVGTIENGQTVRVRHTSAPTFGTNTSTTLIVGGIQDTFFSVTLPADITPDPLVFNAQTDVALNSEVTSNAVTISGINTTTAISISGGGQYAIDSGAYTTEAGTISNGQTVTVRHTASNTPGTNTTTTLTVGDATGDFVSTTVPPDTTPDAFSFSAQTDVALNSEVTSNAVTISGINTTTAISISGGGQYAIDSDAYTTEAGTISNGQTVTVRHTASNTPGTNTTTILTVGDATGDFVSTTVPPDTTPDAFSFSAQTDVAPSSEVTSNPITVSGINTAATIVVSAGSQYAIDGGAYTSEAGTIENGQTVVVRHDSANTLGTDTTTTLTVGGVASDFVSTTVPPDTTPDAFSFSAQTDVALSSEVTSNPITVSGINTAATIVVSAGSQYAIDGGAYTSEAGTIENGQTVVVRHTSADISSADTTTTLTVGGVIGTFTSRTRVLEAVTDFEVTVVPTKTIEFSWVDAVGATSYNLYRSLGGGEGYDVQVQDIPPGQQTLTLASDRPLHELLQVQYILQSCNANECVDSSTVGLSASLLSEGVGYFKGFNETFNGRGERFGSSVALSADGLVLAVSAIDESSDATGVSNVRGKPFIQLQSSGAVYMFYRSAQDEPWALRSRIKPEAVPANRYFGRSIALSGDGRTLVVSAAATQNLGNLSVYYFDDGQWKLQQTDLGDLITGLMQVNINQSGGDLALSHDGNRLVVGSRGQGYNDPRIPKDYILVNVGAAFVFDRHPENQTWSFQSTVFAVDLEDAFDDNDNFDVKLFSRAGGNTNDLFGYQVDLSADGTVMAVSAVGEDGDGSALNDNSRFDSGAAYIYRYDGSAWQQQAYIKAPNVDAYDKFGFAIGLSADGSTLAVGAPYEDGSAASNAARYSNNTTSNAGAVYLYHVNDNGVSFADVYLKGSNDLEHGLFGRSLSLNGDGSQLLVSASDNFNAGFGIHAGDEQWTDDDDENRTGAVYAFVRGDSGHYLPTVYLRGIDAASDNHVFGYALDISTDGVTIAIGDSDENNGVATGVNDTAEGSETMRSGAAYIY